MFTTQANGYDKIEVQRKISDLEIQLLNLLKMNREKDAINLKLANAVDKANEIKYSSENLINLKFQKLLILFKNFEKTFTELFKKYPQLNEFITLKDIFNEFINEVHVVLNNESNFISESLTTILVKTEDDPIRILLKKMQYYAKINQNDKTKIDNLEKGASIRRKNIDILNKSHTKAISSKSVTKINGAFEKKGFIANEKSSQIKPISQLKIESDEEYETIADKFLETPNPEILNAYSQHIAYKKSDSYPTPNESGFDLKKAVNPTEDLSTIMEFFKFN